MFQKNPIKKNKQINCLHNTNEDLWVLLGSMLCQIMEQIWPKTGNPLGVFWFLFILLILCLPNVSKNIYHITGSDQFSAQKKGVLVSVAWENIVSSHKAATA